MNMHLTLAIKKHWPSLTLICILVFITYINSLNNVFLSDDLADIVQNPKIGDFGNIFVNHPGILRPFLYWLAFHIGGIDPAVFRSVNILFHLGTAILIYVLFNLISSKRVAIFASAIFAVHPAISEAVVWVSGGMYSQYAFFFLLSFIFYILSKKSEYSSSLKKKYYLASIVSFFMTFMSHPQMPVSLFLVFPLWELASGTLKKNWIKTIPFLLLSLVYLLISISALPAREAGLKTIHYQQAGVDNPLVLLPIAVSSYFELIFFPQTLTLYHSELNLNPIQFGFIFLITLAFLVGILISYKKNKFIFFWSLFFLIALAPTLTPFRLNWIVAERYLYLPIVGIIALIALGLDKLCKNPKLKQTIYVLVSIIVILLSFRTIVRNIDWKNEDNLWIATGKTSPSSPNTHNNLGDVYGRHGDKEAALREFLTAIALKPNYGDAYHNAGNVYRELGQLDKALEYYQKALEFNPTLWQSYQNIAALYFEQKKYDLSIENLQKGIAINPNNLNLRNGLGIVYLVSGDKVKAKEAFTIVLNMDPNNQVASQGILETSK